MTLQQRLAGVPVLGTAMAVQRRYKADAADQLAAAIGFFAFLALVPLLLIGVAIAGFVWSDPQRQVDVALAITGAVPGLDDALTEGQASDGVTTFVEGIVAQRATIGGIGLLLLLPTGLKVVASAMAATRIVLRGEVLTGVGARVRQLLAMVGLGAVALLAAGASSLATILGGWLHPALAVTVAVGLTFALDLALFLVAYRLLSPTAELTARQLLPGAVLAAAGWSGLKVGGATFVGRQADSADALYGAVGGIVVLLLLLYLAGRLYLYGAELSAILVERESGPLVAPDPAGAHAAVLAGPAPSGPPVPSGAGARARLAAARADRDRAMQRQAVAGDQRTAVAFGVAAAALAAGWHLLGRRSG